MARLVAPPPTALEDREAAARLLDKVLNELALPSIMGWSEANVPILRRAHREVDRFLPGLTAGDRRHDPGAVEALEAVEALLEAEGLGHLADRARARVEWNEALTGHDRG